MSAGKISGLVLLLLILAGCGRAETDSAGGVDAAPAPEVAVMVAVPRERPLVQTYPGRLTAFRRAEVRARAAGILVKRHYEEGREVAEGDLLFTIDDAQLKINRLSAQSALARAEAEHQGTLDTLSRHRSLVEKKSINEHDYIASVTAEKRAQAEVDSARAALAKAELDLSYARVDAPISGRAGLALVSEGALVGQDGLTPMTTIEQIDPIYVDFSQPASDLLAVDSAVKSGRLRKIDQAGVQVRLNLPDGSVYEHPGRLLFIDTSVDPRTDGVAMRAVFPNPDKTLRPGTYLGVSLSRAVNPQVFLVPRDSLLRQEGESHLLIVSDQNLVEKRPVEAAELDGKNWVVTGGLRPGDQVILNIAQGAALEGQKVSIAATTTSSTETLALRRD